MRLEQRQHDAKSSTAKKTKLTQPKLQQLLKTSDGESADLAVAQWAFAHDIPANALSGIYWKTMTKKLAQVSPMYKPMNPQKLQKKMLPLLLQMAKMQRTRHLKHQPDTGRTLTGDGATKKVPLINFLVHVPGKGVTLMEVTDCTGHMGEGGTKDALYVIVWFFVVVELDACNNALLIACCDRYVAHRMKKVIEKIGAKTILLVVIDGGSDWTATQQMIQEFFPWISFMHCLSHEVSLILKDCFKVDGGIEELSELNEWITDAQHWFSTHACASFLIQQKQPNECARFIWPAVTRYCGVFLKIKRFHSMKELLRRVVNSGVYQEKFFVEDPFPAKIMAADVWTLMGRVIKCMGPLLLLCRLADGQKPVISKLYGTQLYVRDEIERSAAAAGTYVSYLILVHTCTHTLPQHTNPSPTTYAGAGSVEEKIRDVFLTRWSEMQSPIVSASYMLDPLWVDKSKLAATCTIKLWELARKVCVHVYVCTCSDVLVMHVNA